MKGIKLIIYWANIIIMVGIICKSGEYVAQIIYKKDVYTLGWEKSFPTICTVVELENNQLIIVFLEDRIVYSRKLFIINDKIYIDKSEELFTAKIDVVTVKYLPYCGAILIGEKSIQQYNKILETSQGKKVIYWKDDKFITKTSINGYIMKGIKIATVDENFGNIELTTTDGLSIRLDVKTY